MSQTTAQKAIERQHRAQGNTHVKGWIKQSDRPAFEEMKARAEKDVKAVEDKAHDADG